MGGRLYLIEIEALFRHWFSTGNRQRPYAKGKRGKSLVTLADRGQMHEVSSAGSAELEGPTDAGLTAFGLAEGHAQRHALHAFVERGVDVIVRARFGVPHASVARDLEVDRLRGLRRTFRGPRNPVRVGGSPPRRATAMAAPFPAPRARARRRAPAETPGSPIVVAAENRRAVGRRAIRGEGAARRERRTRTTAPSRCARGRMRPRPQAHST